MNTEKANRRTKPFSGGDDIGLKPRVDPLSRDQTMGFDHGCVHHQPVLSAGLPGRTVRHSHAKPYSVLERKGVCTDSVLERHADAMAVGPRTHRASGTRQASDRQKPASEQVREQAGGKSANVAAGFQILIRNPVIIDTVSTLVRTPAKGPTPGNPGKLAFAPGVPGNPDARPSCTLA